MKRKQWVAAEQTLFAYVSNKRLNKHNPEVWYSLGLARYNQQNYLGKSSAAVAFFRCYSKYGGYFQYSCPSVNYGIEIERDHGSKQTAYELADRWLKSMAKHVDHPVAGPYLSKTRDLRSALEQDSSVTVKEE